MYEMRKPKQLEQIFLQSVEKCPTIYLTGSRSVVTPPPKYKLVLGRTLFESSKFGFGK